MTKKIIVLLLNISALSLNVRADELTLDLMLINNYNMRQDQDIWSRMREGFRLNHKQTKQVVYYEKLYTKNPKTFSKIVNNAKPYIYYILTETERNGMPTEVALLPGVESTFNPNARSSSNAYGMWQFVPSTGTRFKLVQNNEIDERQDIVKSTQSALWYLNYLHSIFGQWEPAIGAYNWGEGNMYKEIVKSGQTPGSIDYANLNLREETSNYLPKLIALASIIENPDKFGVNLDEMENKPFFAIINPAAPIQLTDLADKAGIDKKTFAMLNPQYKSTNYVLSSKDSILLPIDNQNIYYANIGQPTATNNTSTPLIPTNNNDATEEDSAPQPSNALDQLVDKLDTTAETRGDEDTAADTQAPINYTIASGDTLYSIAKRFNAKIDDIRRENKIPGNDITVGQTIIIPQYMASK
ncbi:MAG: transglycosylase SLT domain-containing protein [Burkholderiales bacterium]|nr:transglycosylase SLT domain-containing protein [Burkholderiales bacterium]